MSKRRRPPRPTRQRRFETLLEDVGQGYLWGRENGNSDAMAFSSGVLMGALTMLHPTYTKDQLTTLHKEMLDDLEQRYDTFKAREGITFIVPLDDDNTDQNEGDL
jgi:hypothetical protein